MNQYLAHIGVKRKSGRYPYGSGERPYQRENIPVGGGSDSTASSEETPNRRDTWFSPGMKTGKGKENVSPAEKVTNESKKIASEAKNINAAIRKANRASGKALSEISDEDLRKAINRMSLERQYNSLTTENTRSGWDYAEAVLDVVGSVLGIAGSAASIAATIYWIQNKTG